MIPERFEWEFVEWTAADELAAQIAEVIRDAMPKNVAWWRVSLATHQVMELLKDRDP